MVILQMTKQKNITNFPSSIQSNAVVFKQRKECEWKDKKVNEKIHINAEKYLLKA
jgi:hypothetical protein